MIVGVLNIKAYGLYLVFYNYMGKYPGIVNYS
jgi:hypothetical protein